MKKILGLDVGTNSVGWALIDHDFNNKEGKIHGMGARIIPMSQDEISNFNVGNLQSSASQRTMYRGVRRLRERSINRRNRLIKVLKILGFIPHEFEVNHIHSIAYTTIGEKHRFKFLSSYKEMEELFVEKHDSKVAIPFDWTIYFLRRKALREKISKEELAWVILQFNSKRGYFQLRGDNTLDTDNKKYFVSDIVDNITKLDKSGSNTVFEIELRNDIIGTFVSKEEPKWIGREINFIVTEKRLKSGELKVSLSAPNEDDWTLRKKKTESDIEHSQKTVGEFIFDKLLTNPKSKIRGELVHTIDRKLFKKELLNILEKQSEYYPELKDKKLFDKAAHTLYKNNTEHRKNLLKTSISNLIVDDIIYYQRPLKSKKHLITNCKYESYHYSENGQVTSKPVKGIPKSNPLFQEFRIWALIHNIRILQREYRTSNGVLKFDYDVTKSFLTFEAKEKLFALFNVKKEVTHTQLLKCIGLESAEFRLNYEEGKKLLGNETIGSILSVLSEKENKSEFMSILDDQQKIQNIWHAIYSLTESSDHLRKALTNERVNLSAALTEELIKVDPFKKDYSFLSEKAIKKLLPLMRCGRYWNEESIDNYTRERIASIINAEFDDSISERVREKLVGISSITDFQGLPEWLASYVVYNRHSEFVNTKNYESPEDIDVNSLIPQHSLRNPVVEKILRETLLVVRDIWKHYGRPDEIHVELAREMNLPNDMRKRYTEKRNENELRNKRAIAMLRELQKENHNINPYSIGQLELFKLYEEGATNNNTNLDDDIKAIKRKGDPTTSELNRYKLWLDQKYLSPYTGQPIPLSKLFTPNYEIEHIIPKSKYYDNSFNNKIICEREANKLKADSTAYEFICNMGGKVLDNGYNLLKKEQYEELVLKMFKGQRTKIKNLLSYDVPKSFNSVQLNNTRYISKKLLTLLNPVVKEPYEKDWKSKNLIPLNGGITSKLRRDWGLNDVWKKLLAPRFERMNNLSGTQDYYSIKNGRIDLNGNETDIKRLDHRHHALDALVVACTSVQHIQYLETIQRNNIRDELRKKLFIKDKRDRFTSEYIKPWKNFTKEAYDNLIKIIPSFKQSNRVINRTKNYYQRYVQKNGNFIKSYVQQKKTEDFWAIRKPLHKDTVFGQRTIREYKEVSLNNALNDMSKVADATIRKKLKKLFIEHNEDIKALKTYLKKNPLLENGKEIKRLKVFVENPGYASSRKFLDTSFTEKIIQEKVLDDGVRKILLNHLKKYNGDPKLAFDPNGLMDLNEQRNIPIKRVTKVESLGKKFKLGECETNKNNYVKAAKDTNLFFVVYKNIETGEHVISAESTIRFGDAVNLMKEGLPLAEEKEGFVQIVLSPGDLVYVLKDGKLNMETEDMDFNSIYKCVKFNGSQCFFIPACYASIINDGKEVSKNNCQERSLDGDMIKYQFRKLNVNRLGIIKR